MTPLIKWGRTWFNVYINIWPWYILGIFKRVVCIQRFGGRIIKSLPLISEQLINHEPYLKIQKAGAISLSLRRTAVMSCITLNPISYVCCRGKYNINQSEKGCSSKHLHLKYFCLQLDYFEIINERVIDLGLPVFNFWNLNLQNAWSVR